GRAASRTRPRRYAPRDSNRLSPKAPAQPRKIWRTTKCPDRPYPAPCPSKWEWRSAFDPLSFPAFYNPKQKGGAVVYPISGIQRRRIFRVWAGAFGGSLFELRSREAAKGRVLPTPARTRKIRVVRQSRTAAAARNWVHRSAPVFRTQTNSARQITSKTKELK